MGAKPSPVAQRIEEVRSEKKLSRAALAKRLSTRRRKVTRLQVWRIETGKTRITADVAARCAEALGVDITALYRTERRAS